MASTEDDPRLDPRVKAVLALVPVPPASDVTSREELLAEMASPESLAMREQMNALFEMLDDETNAPSAGLDISTVECASEPDGNTIRLQVIRPETAQTLTRILADAIVGESSNKALVPGYRIAGKTGTASIPIPGGYDPVNTIASFAGYLPADDPHYVILVKLDKPQSSEWGSQVASPVFAAVAKQLVAMAGLPPDAIRLAAK